MKVRADQLLVSRGLAPTRARAQALILAGKVFGKDSRIDKGGVMLDAEAEISVRGEDNPYVSRGGLKLQGALDAFGVDPTGMRCVDLGASTGGFTDCLLSRGASHVAAVDVGYGQLAHKLRVDPRVLVLERTNAKTLAPEHVGGPADLVVVDASFIGLGKLTEAIARCLREGGLVLALIKPQFEVGRAEANRSKGVVRDPEVRARAIDAATSDVARAGLEILGVCDSTVPGPKGNLEAFVFARKRSSASPGSS